MLVLAVGAAGCSASAAIRPVAAWTTATPTIRVGSTDMGQVLVAPSGLTLYAFSADSPSDIVCQAACLSIWPPLDVAAGAEPTAGHGPKGSLGTVTRPDGTRQVTYNGLLLYTYAGDSAAGQTNGQGIAEQYGSVKGTWFVVTPASTGPPSPSAVTTTSPRGAPY